jgi:hypothetical protein
MEGIPGVVVHFALAPDGAVSATSETPIDQLFRSAYLTSSGNDFRKPAAWYPYYIPAFNDVPAIQDPDTGEVFNPIGIEQYNHLVSHETSAWFLKRSRDGKDYSLHEVAQLGAPQDPNLGLRAVRTIVVSPFQEDGGRVLYVGGFDPVWECDSDPRAKSDPKNDWKSRYNAWVYRVGMRTALKPFSD